MRYMCCAFWTSTHVRHAWAWVQDEGHALLVSLSRSNAQPRAIQQPSGIPLQAHVRDCEETYCSPKSTGAEYECYLVLRRRICFSALAVAFAILGVLVLVSSSDGRTACNRRRSPLTLMSCIHTFAGSGRRMIEGETRYSMCAPC